jgi:hypothetical protein
MGKQQYRIRNWKDYNQSLVKRGSLTLWIDEKIHQEWYSLGKDNGDKGRPVVYSDIVIETILMLKAVYGLPYRATIGLVKSIIKLMNLSLEMPHYSTVSRRSKRLSIALEPLKTQGAIHLALDSTGLKIYGEGEWKVRQHGVGKRRTWRKLHLAVNPENGQIESAIVTTNDFKDSELLPDLVDGIDKPITSLSGDGGYDSHTCYEYLNDRGIKPLIPPRKDAVVAKHGNCKGPKNPRDEVIRAINQQGRKSWKQNSGYHQRSLSETAMFRFKTLFGDKLSARVFESQATEALVRCKALNKISSLGMPESYKIS